MKILFIIFALGIFIQGCAPVKPISSPYQQTYSSKAINSIYENLIEQSNNELNHLDCKISKEKRNEEKEDLKIKIKEQKRVIEAQKKICEQLERDRQHKLATEQNLQARERYIREEEQYYKTHKNRFNEFDSRRSMEDLARRLKS
ncbi:MAG: hypothetical protein CNLJKLNK_00331 [Holosporales bacterium]